MAITTKDELIAAIAAAQTYSYLCASLANTAVGQLFSLWRANGAPLQGAIPGGAATCTGSLTGAVPFTNPTSPALSYLGQLALQAANQGSAIIFDRLAHMGGLNGTSTNSQTVNVTLPGNRGVLSGYSNVEWYLEWYGDTGGTGVNATITYTNQNGTTGRTTTVGVGGTTRVGRMMLIVPAAGDEIQSIQSVTLSASTGTAGNFGVTACIRLAELSVANPALISTMDAFNLGLPRIYDNACLMRAVLCSTTSTGLIQGRTQIIQG